MSKGLLMLMIMASQKLAILLLSFSCENEIFRDDDSQDQSGEEES